MNKCSMCGERIPGCKCEIDYCMCGIDYGQGEDKTTIEFKCKNCGKEYHMLYGNKYRCSCGYKGVIYE